jgi:plasmid rolling circle replication initiator protein Rep
MNNERGQEVLSDRSATGKARPWASKKLNNTYMALAYDNINVKKAERLRDCAEVLVFRRLEGDGMKLHSMNSCRVRLCPVCGWRRSLKIFANVSKVMEGMKTEKTYAFVFLTLTVRNCRGEELGQTITDMMAAWQRMTQTKWFRNTVKGTYRGLEVTHNVDDTSTSYDTYHPHFHCVLAVNKTYLTDPKQYMSHDGWVEMWQKANRFDYKPMVNVKRVKGDTAKAVAEVAKYTVKDGDIIIADDWDLTIETVRILDAALADRRLVSFGGKMREWHKKLNLQDEMSGDLVNVDGEKPSGEAGAGLITFAWNVGYNQYFRQGM